MRLVVLALTLCLVPAYASSVREINANAEGITFTVEDTANALESAAEDAQEHCTKFDRVAVMQSTDSVAQQDRIVNFSCVVSR